MMWYHRTLLHIERVLLYPINQKTVSTKWLIYKGKICLVRLNEKSCGTSKMGKREGKLWERDLLKHEGNRILLYILGWRID